LRVPQALKKWGADLVFNTKFSVPLTIKMKRIMALHGASWFVHPELYKKFDIFYVRFAIPIYCRTADFLISNSELTTSDYKRIVGVPSEKIKTVPLAAGKEFIPIEDPTILDEVKNKYRLPNRFILTVTSYDPRKNFETLLKSFKLCRNEIDIKLVVIGKDCYKYSNDFNLNERGLAGAISFPGWVDQKDLPAVYSLANAFAFPSVYEEFGIPVVEAMSCGCPVVASNTGAIPSLVKDAGLLCSPFDQEQLARNLLRILSSEDTASRHRKLGLERAKEFSWEKAARQTLEIFESVVLGNRFSEKLKDKKLQRFRDEC
jgi:glycosyltransferase involved in cell wall biosynthesis